MLGVFTPQDGEIYKVFTYYNIVGISLYIMSCLVLHFLGVVVYLMENLSLIVYDSYL